MTGDRKSFSSVFEAAKNNMPHEAILHAFETAAHEFEKKYSLSYDLT